MRKEDSKITHSRQLTTVTNRARWILRKYGVGFSVNMVKSKWLHISCLLGTQGGEHSYWRRVQFYLGFGPKKMPSALLFPNNHRKNVYPARSASNSIFQPCI